jgi:hypothetical protein
MIVKFGEDTDSFTMGAILASITKWTIDVEYAEGVTAFPKRCAIFQTSLEDIVICDVDETGSPITNSLYHVGYDEIKSITIL